MQNKKGQLMNNYKKQQLEEEISDLKKQLNELVDYLNYVQNEKSIKLTQNDLENINQHLETLHDKIESKLNELSDLQAKKSKKKVVQDHYEILENHQIRSKSYNRPFRHADTSKRLERDINQYIENISKRKEEQTRNRSKKAEEQLSKSKPKSKNTKGQSNSAQKGKNQVMNTNNTQGKEQQFINHDDFFLQKEQSNVQKSLVERIDLLSSKQLIDYHKHLVSKAQQIYYKIQKLKNNKVPDIAL